MHVSLAVLATLGRGGNQLTGALREAIVAAIVRAKNNHNNRLLTLGEFIAVTRQCTPARRSGHANYIAALATLSEPGGSVQQVVSLAPRRPFRAGHAGSRLAGEGCESFR